MSEPKIEEVLATILKEQRRDRRLFLGALVLVGLAVPGVLAAATVSVPYTFSPNTTAYSSQVNANFATLATEATRVSNIVQGPGNGTSSNRVLNLAAPLASDDAASKAYVDAAMAGNTGAVLTLIGKTSCPTGWTVALTGIPVFYPGSSSYDCFDTDGLVLAPFADGWEPYSTASTSTKSALGWLPNGDGYAYGAPTIGAAGWGSCVICVK